ncbi:MAG: PorT family protein [Bacteroidales bacterium]|nr:PorT family protein [Bacteroidales bacterium]MCD4789375.1 PorT family protein [Bacteroidales bacterium]
MKKALLLLTIVLLGVTINAQNIAIGGKIGGNLSSFYGKDMPDYNYKFGLVFGLASQFKVGNHFYLQPELNYEQKGAKHKLSIMGNDQESTYKLNYLTIPVLAKICFGNKETFFINAGPFIGFLIKATDRNYVTNSNTGAVISDDSGDITKYQKNADIGFTAGGGAAFRLSDKTRLFIDARYKVSFTSINKENALGFPKNQSFNFNTGLLFNIR